MILFPKAAQRHADRRDPAGVLIPSMLIVGLICGAIAVFYRYFGNTIVRLTLGPEYQIDGRLLGLVGLAMLLLSLANVWLNYFLSIEWPRYIYLIGLAILIQGALMVTFHEELWQFPAAMAINGLWLTLMGAGIFLYKRRRR
jgi:O-antigen/teichoic acid export membrane protein